MSPRLFLLLLPVILVSDLWHHCHYQSRDALLLFSSSFTVSRLAFTSVIQLNCWVRCKIEACFRCFACAHPVFPMPFVEKAILFPSCVLGTHAEDRLTRYMRFYFWAICFYWYVCFLCQHNNFHDCNFLTYFEIRKCDVSSFVRPSQDCFGCAGSLVVPPLPTIEIIPFISKIPLRGWISLKVKKEGCGKGRC